MARQYPLLRFGMRLLDQVAQNRNPLWITSTGRCESRHGSGDVRLPGAADFAAQVAACPLRYVLDDDLTGVCADLALSDGIRLSQCLDLIHLPATQMWMEWNDSARGPTWSDSAHAEQIAGNVRAGALISAAANGRSAKLRTFWSDSIAGVTLAPLETHLNLDGEWPVADTQADVFNGGWAQVTLPEDEGLGALLKCMRFRFDWEWARYYRQVAVAAADRDRVLRGSLACVARDMPLIVAFSLLLATRNGLEARRIDWARLNRSRIRKGRAPLLDHIELSCPLVPAAPNIVKGELVSASLRRGPRLHFVRGHLVRRENEIFWRIAHVRGRASMGRVLSRTVHFSFGLKATGYPSHRSEALMRAKQTSAPDS